MTSALRPLPATGPNAGQIEYWNEACGPRWVAAAELLDAQMSSLGLAAMDRGAPAAGERAIDVGCGCGQTTLQLAERVEPGGSVLGVDVSAVMLARAAERAEAMRVSNVRFENSDAQTHAFEPGRFDLVYSRLGVMFFADPCAAFANLRRALRSGGRLAFACWQELARNLWMRELLAAAARHLPLPAPPEPGAPGPFSLADPERLHDVLGAAGFEALGIEAWEKPLELGGGAGLEKVARLLVEVGPTGAALREAGPEYREPVLDAVREVLRAHETPAGVRMGAAAWLVTARNPD